MRTLGKAVLEAGSSQCFTRASHELAFDDEIHLGRRAMGEIAPRSPKWEPAIARWPGTFACNSNPYSAVFDGTNILVINQPADQVAKLRASNSALLGFSRLVLRANRHSSGANG
jgi:hypothetical protein